MVLLHHVASGLVALYRLLRALLLRLGDEVVVLLHVAHEISSCFVELAARAVVHVH